MKSTVEKIATNKKIIFAICFSLISFTVSSQVNPGMWTFTANKIADKQYEIHYTIKISSPWHIYSQFTPDGGPPKTSMKFTPNPLILSKSKISENGKLTTKHEEVFKIDVKYFENTVDFVQVVTLRSAAKTFLKGNVEYMLCRDKLCLPPTIMPFSISLK